MKKSQILIFLLILVAELVVVWLDFKTGEILFKPLVCISLAVFFVIQAKSIKDSLKKWVILALIFSCAGDVLLLFQSDQSIYFLAGLTAFLVAHLFYIIFFHFIRLRENIRSRVSLVVVVVIYYTILIFFLGPYLGSLAIPVRVYGIVISFMLMLALHMLFINDRKAGTSFILGAALFVLSDSILAINKFYQSFETAGVFIMLTYGLAQLFITRGAIRYISSAYKE